MISGNLLILEQVSRQILIVVLGAGLKGLLVITCVYVVLSCTKRASAHTRHYVWFLSIAGLVLLPIFSLLFQRIEVGVLRAPENPGSAYRMFASVVSGDPSSAKPLLLQNPVAGAAIANPPTVQGITYKGQTAITSSGWTIGLSVWVFGAAVAFSRTILRRARARKIVRNGTELKEGKMISLLDELRTETGVRVAIRLVSSSRIVSPFTIGTFGPAIVLPAEMASWSTNDITPALLHEIHHVRRKDDLTQSAAMFCSALFWFVPFAWIALNRLYAEQEKACDMEVILAGIQRKHYAKQMLRIAYSMLSAPVYTGQFMMRGRRKLFERRIVNILESRGARARRWTSILVGGVQLMVLAALAAFVTERAFAVNAVEFRVGTPKHTSINTALQAKGLDMRLVSIIDEGGTGEYNGITLSSYALSETEVTQGDYESVSGPTGKWYLGGAGDTYPEYSVTWYEAAAFCNRLSDLLGLEAVYNEITWEADFTRNGFYLPLEAQWEYAFGGRSHNDWSLGDSFNAAEYVAFVDQLGPVKSRPANDFGLYDMGGNVYEWCHDWYGEDYPEAGSLDPTGPPGGTYRVARGGSFDSADVSFLRADWRAAASRPSTSCGSLGFRVAAGGFGNWEEAQPKISASPELM